MNLKIVSYHWILCVALRFTVKTNYGLSKTNSVWSFIPITMHKLRHFSEYKQAKNFCSLLYHSGYTLWKVKWKLYDIYSLWIVKYPFYLLWNVINTPPPPFITLNLGIPMLSPGNCQLFKNIWLIPSKLTGHWNGSHLEYTHNLCNCYIPWANSIEHKAGGY